MSEKKESIINAKNNSVALARFFIDHYKNLVLDYNKLLYIYEESEGIYTEVDDKRFDKLLMQFLIKNNITEIWKLNRINEIRRAVYAGNTIKQVKFDIYDNLICLKNCIINLDEMKKVDFSPDYYFTTKVNINYDSAAKPPVVFADFLKSTFTNREGKPDINTINNIVRIGGYLLYPQNKLEIMFLFLGEGSNGKSVLITLFEMFFNEKSLTHLDLNEMSKSSSFERECLIGSRLNTCTEAKSSKVDSEIIKTVISSEGLTIFRRYRGPITYNPITKLVVASNTQPFFNDSTHGLYRRIFPITFKNRFVSEEDYAKHKDPAKKGIFIKYDKGELLQKLKDELPGIINLFLGGLKNLRENRWILEMSNNSSETLSEYKNSADSITHFLVEFYEEDHNEDFEGLTAEEILKEYREWYRDNVSEKPLNYGSQSLGRKIREMWRIEAKRTYINSNKRERIYPLKRRNYVEEELKILGTDGNIAKGSMDNAAEISQEKIEF